MHASCTFAAADVATVHVRARTPHVDARGWASAPGFFHLATWAFVGAATVLIVQAWQRGEPAPPWRTHVGLVLAGWGIFNLVEGVCRCSPLVTT
jgi:hypothetical protein